MTIDPRHEEIPPRAKSGYAVSRSDHGDVLRELQRINVRLSRIEGGLMLGGFLLTLGVAIAAVIGAHV